MSIEKLIRISLKEGAKKAELTDEQKQDLLLKILFKFLKSHIGNKE